MEFFFLSDSHSFSDTVAIADKVERKIPHLFFAYISHLVSYGLVHWSIFKPNSLCLFFCSSFLFSLSLPQVKEPVNHIKTSHSLLIFQSGLCNKKKIKSVLSLFSFPLPSTLLSLHLFHYRNLQLLLSFCAYEPIHVHTRGCMCLYMYTFKYVRVSLFIYLYTNRVAMFA